MAKRRYKKSRRGGKKKLPLAVAVPIAAVGYNVGKQIMAGDTGSAVYIMTGIRGDGSFNPNKLVEAYAPVAAGILVHKVASRLGANRYIPSWLPVSI